MDILSVRNLTKYYGKKCGVEKVDFDIQSGEIFGFVGPNGAGKSTTIRCILGLLNYSSGDIKIFGQDNKQFLVSNLAKIGYVPAEINYYPNTKAKDLLKYSASFYKKNCDEKIEEYAKYLDLDLNMKIDDMSLGNKKKVGIIQALIHEPEFIILDEPTSGLDPLIQRRVYNLLRKLADEGKTILYSSHVLSEVQNICDRVAIIKAGEIIALQTVKELKEMYYNKVSIYANSLNIDKLANVTNLMVSNNHYEFNYNGSVNELTKFLAGEDIYDLKITELDLEDIFMHYYE